MRRSVVGLLALLVGTPLALSPSAAGQDPPSIKMRVATTKTKLTAFGHVKVPGPGRIRLTFSHLEGDVEAITGKRVTVRDDGSFSGSFERPESGTCTITANYKADDGRVKDTDELDCTRPEWGTGEAVLQTDNDSKTIAVEIADDGSERQYGLMYRKHLGAEKGMVFQFPSDSTGGFWMRNCLIPLSIAFYDAVGEIVAILDMQPCSEVDSETGDCQIYDPGETYRGALEVNLGAFDEWGVEVGDKILVSEDL